MSKVFNLEQYANSTKYVLTLVDLFDYNYKPSEIVRLLDQFVVGQDSAKKILALSLCNHLALLKYNSKEKVKKLKKTNLLLVGSSGTGKTLLVETLAKVLNLDTITVDITSYSNTGYVGNNIEDIIYDFYFKCGKDKERTERGIIFIDEIDKIGTYDTDSNVSTTGVQRSLLKFIEGTSINVTYKMHGETYTQAIDTTDILFIFGGAFTSLIEDKLSERGKSLGFSTDTVIVEEEKENYLTSENLIEAGLFRELVGRINRIVELKKLTKADYIKIVRDLGDVSLIKQLQILADHRGLKVKIELTDEELDAMIDKAVKLDIGARGLKTLIEEKFTDIMYE